MIGVTSSGVFTRRLAMSAGAKARLLPAPSRARSGVSLTIGRNSRERRRDRTGCGRSRRSPPVFDHPVDSHERDATSSESPHPSILLHAGQSRQTVSRSSRRRVRVRAEHSGPQARPQRRRASARGSSPSASVKRLRKSSSKNQLWLWRIAVLLKRPLAFKFHPHERLVDNPIHRKSV